VRREAEVGEEQPVSRHFAVYVLPGLAAVGAATVVRSLALGTLATAMLAVAIILSGAAWVLIAARRFK
jgi:hypothetical protein